MKSHHFVEVNQLILKMYTVWGFEMDFISSFLWINNDKKQYDKSKQTVFWGEVSGNKLQIIKLCYNKKLLKH